ncbi:DUF2239 family protein [Alicyclobacillus sp. SO9]|uniref:DUF2239 family protein n=1 Tax=Alicyclobacillus sp. SO9 TaxID=2665646 RepID=UPI0018E86A76|nr:DUF2239 family protein [Alicyclobacillus sp. SO9]QQE80063.1 DUF2239 family protein [Alicyclobacillus sp. SO9]
MESSTEDRVYSAFAGDELIQTGSLREVVSKVKNELDDDDLSRVLIFDDTTGRVTDVDFRGTITDVLQRLSCDFEGGSVASSVTSSDAGDAVNRDKPRRVGRPKLGVVPGEVTLLPRHWDWLKSQPGGASVTLRKLVEEARRARANKDAMRQAQEATYGFMTAMAGNRPHYEEALRALYAKDSQLFYQLIEDWAEDVRNHIKKLAQNAFLAEDKG